MDADALIQFVDFSTPKARRALVGKLVAFRIKLGGRYDAYIALRSGEVQRAMGREIEVDGSWYKVADIRSMWLA